MKAWAIPEVRLVFWGFCLNALWEVLQSPLYTDFHRGLGYLVWTRLHCTGGDVLILLAAFWAVSLAFRTRDWARRSGQPAAALFVSLGLAYTACGGREAARYERGTDKELDLGQEARNRRATIADASARVGACSPSAGGWRSGCPP